MSVSREVFARLHIALMERYKDHMQGKPEVHLVDCLYGIGEYAEKDSIAGMVRDGLEKRDYSWPGFPKNSKGLRSFQGGTLKKARIAYEKGLEINLSDKYLQAYLFYLECQNCEDILNKFFLPKLPALLLKKKDARGKKLKISLMMTLTEKDLLRKYIDLINKQLSGTHWYLYSLNRHQNKVIRAVVHIEKLDTTGHARVTLKNPKSDGRPYKDYQGILSLNHIKHNILSFELTTQFNTKCIRLTMQCDPDTDEQIEWMIGVMVKTNDSRQLSYTDVLMNIISDESNAEPFAFDKEDIEEDPKLNGFFNTKNFVYKCY